MADFNYLFALLLAFSPVLIWIIWKNPLYLLAVHIFSRVLLDSFSEYTYISLGPLSLMQVYSVAIIGIVALYVVAKGRFDCFAFKFPIALIAFIAISSSAINLLWQGLPVIALKWVYLGVLVGLVHLCFRTNSLNKILFTVWLCLLYPVLNQAYYIATNQPAVSGGVTSYLGSYGHESDLGFLLLGFLATSVGLYVTTTNRLYSISLFLMIAYTHVAVYLNNYRTVTASLLIFWATIFLLHFRKLPARRKIVAIVIACVAPMSVLIIIGSNLSTLFSDVFVFLGEPSRYLDFSGDAQPNRLMSGRIDIINKLMSAYLNSPIHILVIGLGPGSAEAFAGVYSHNEYLSALVETGILGFVVLVAVGLFIVIRCYRVAVVERGISIILCAVVYSVVFTGVATMPFRDMRAMMILSLCLGAIAYYHAERRKRLRLEKRSRIRSNTLRSANEPDGYDSAPLAAR